MCAYQTNWSQRNRDRLSYIWAKLSVRYQQAGNVDDIHYAVAVAQLISNLTTYDHPEKAEALHMVGISRGLRFEHLGIPRDLDAAITAHRLAAEMAPDGQPLKIASLSALGSMQKIRFEQLGDVNDLELAVSNLRLASDLTPSGDSAKLDRPNNYSISLHTRFRRLGDLNDLEACIAGMKEVVRKTPDEHSDKASRLSNLGLAQRARSGRLGTLDDLKEAVKHLSRAADLTPDRHPGRPSILNNLSIARQAHFERFGNLEDLEHAIAALRKALTLTPHNHPSMPALSSNLAAVLKERFARRGVIDDLQEAIAAMKHGIELTLDGHPDKPTWLSNLGDALRQRYSRLGNLEDLEAALSYQNKATKLLPRGNAEEHGRLATLGLIHFSRFQRLGGLNDLHMAIETLDRAVALTPNGHPEKPARLANLALAYSSPNEAHHVGNDLDKAIILHGEALRLVPDEHIDKPSHLNNCGRAFLLRFQRDGSLPDLDSASKAFALAIKLTSNKDPEKPSRLSNMGYTCFKRFERFGESGDIDRALDFVHEAIELIPEQHALVVDLLAIAGEFYFTRALSTHSKPDDIFTAISTYMSALNAKSGNPSVKLGAGIKLMSFLSTPGLPPSAIAAILDVYPVIRDLVPQVVWLGHDINRRYKELARLGALSIRGAAAAIAGGQYAQAIEWLEDGRSIVWSQLLHLQSPLDDLRKHHPDIAVRLEQASRALRMGTSIDGASPEGPITLDAQAKSQYSTALEYDKLIAEIRQFKGYEYFLRSKPFSQLASACSSAHIVIVNVDKLRCDALILHGHKDVIHVPLTSFSFDRAEALQQKLRESLGRLNLLGRYRDASANEKEQNTRGGRTGPVHQDTLPGILSELWRDVVKPVLDQINNLPTRVFSKYSTLPRIIWCPTGPLVFLPLHAAGVYRDKGRSETVLDFAVSSYTPTIDVITRSQLRPQKSTASEGCDKHKILVVSYPGSPGASSYIPNTRVEAGLISSIFPADTTVLDGDNGTVDAVLKAIAKHNWVHLACHGAQNTQDPTQSAFALHDGPLKLSTLMNKELVNAQLAVLSACQTATGEKTLSEEAVHLAAAMLNIGFQSVVGTMWSISDNTAPEVAKAFYEALRDQVKAQEPLQPAYALHEAIQKVRGREDLLRWVPFVHFGY